MKNKIVVSLVLAAAFMSFSLHSQRLPDCVINAEVYTSYVDWYNEALNQLDDCNERNFQSFDTYYLSAMNQFFMGDMHKGIYNLGKAIEFDSTLVDEMFRAWSDVYLDSTSYALEMAASQMETPMLDTLNNFKRINSKRDSVRGLLTFEKTCFDLKYHDLQVKIIPEEKRIEGNNLIRFQMLENSKRIHLDLFEEFEIVSVRMNDSDLTFIREGDMFFVDYPEGWKKEEIYDVTVVYGGRPQIAKEPPWLGGFVWEKASGKDHVGVACEHLGASSWWPTKDVLYDEVDSMDISIIAPADLVAISNGNLVETSLEPDGYKRSKWHVSYPIDNYNVTFYLGDFVHFSEQYISNKGNETPIDYYVLSEHEDSAKHYYRSTIAMMKVMEDLFGEFPFYRDGVGYVEAPYKGMEHQTAIAIGNDYGTDKKDYPDYGDVPYLLVHETAHEWWGNAISVDDMADVWIQEGFATFTEYLFAERYVGKDKYIESIADQMLMIENFWPVVGTRGINDNAFVGGDVYGKGAMTLHNLRSLMNDDSSFFLMIKDFYQENKYKMVNTGTFTGHAQKYTDKNLEPFFQVHLYQTEPPTLQYRYSELKRKGKRKLEARWVNVPEGFEMPALILENGDYPMRVDLTTKWQTFYFEEAYGTFFATPWVIEEDMDTKNAFTYYFTDKLPQEKSKSKRRREW